MATGDTTQGRRYPDVDHSAGRCALMEPGGYRFARYSENMACWECCTPDGSLGNLSAHQVAVHEDGTITVSPSILVGGGNMTELWPSYLERGVWREV